MTLNWETFKTASGLSNSSLAYIDDEGSEIPIGSDCEFQEALRFAKLNKNRLKFILYEDKVKPFEKVSLGLGQPQKSGLKISDTFTEELNKTYTMIPSLKDDDCGCHGDVPPEWFLHYMQMFQKELLHDLKSQIGDVVHSALEKRLKQMTVRELLGDDFFKLEKEKKSPTVKESVAEKSENSFSPVSTQSKKKKKASEKDSTDVTDQREMKLPKKLAKLHATKSERLEKLDNKTRVLLEEKRLLERKRHSKSKLDKNSNDKKILLKKSAFFWPDEIYICLPPGSKFSVTLNVINDGKVRWSAPRLQCFEMKGLTLKEGRINLPRLLPTESFSVTLKGQVSQSAGLHYVKCKVVDGSECFGPEFTCFARVEGTPESPAESKESEDKEWVVGKEPQDEGALIDFEKDIISSSKRKIEENINEIQRRLQDIDLLRPSTSAENVKKSSGKGSKLMKNAEKVQTGCDLMLMLDEKEESWKERLVQEDLLFGSEAAVETCNFEMENEKDKNEEDGIVKICEKHGELECCSDSDGTVSFKFDDEDNFIFVPSKSPSPAESANEEKTFLIIGDVKEKTPASNDEFKCPPVIPETKPATVEHIEKEETRPVNENNQENRFSPVRNRRSPFGEEISKPKKMKSKSTEYRFTAANLTQPTFTKIPEGFSSKFKFSTGEEERLHAKEASEGRPRNFTFTAAKGTKSKEFPLGCQRKVRQTDAAGKVIFAVNRNGFCVPVENLFAPERRPEDPECCRTFERRNERADIPAVNILPNVLMNGASNMASFAFNTAKSVLSNFQSAFVTEGKTEFGQPAYEDKVKVSMDAMFKLYDMGFLDLHLNRKFLILHDNDLNKVIEEYVLLSKNSGKESQ